MRKFNTSTAEHLPDEADLRCPFCDQIFKLYVDISAGLVQEFPYDCELCCHPLLVKIKFNEQGQVEAVAAREDES